MKTKIAIIGMGNLGYQIATILKDNYGSEYLFPTRKNKEKIDKHKRDFPNFSNDNLYAIKNAEIILLIVHPEDINQVMKEINPLIKDKLVVNFTTKVIDLESPLIHVASSPVINNKIKILFHKTNNQVGKNHLNKFKEIFRPLTKYFSECKYPVKELGIMSRIYAHNLNYFNLLKEEGNNPDCLKAYFELASDTLKEMVDVKKATSKAQTKKGLTEELFNLYKQTKFSELTKEEKEAIEKKIKSIQEN